jgi:hypothetical protein
LAWVLDADRFEGAADAAKGRLQPPYFDKFTNPNEARPPDSQIEAEHIVVITGPIRADGGDYVVPIWTWAVNFEVRVVKHLFQSFFPMFVFGYFHW